MSPHVTSTFTNPSLPSASLHSTDREVDDIFDRYDIDFSDELDKTEFELFLRDHIASTFDKSLARLTKPRTLDGNEAATDRKEAAIELIEQVYSILDRA